jgi:hypothetical protein
MTGMERLKYLMKAAGASGQLAESRAVPMVVTILANAENGVSAWQIYEEMEKQLEALLKSNTIKARFIAEREDAIEKKYKEADKRLEDIGKKEEECEAKLKEICECETPEARDRMRLAVAYDAMISTANVYQETERIKGLALIMSGRKETENESRQQG